MKKKTFKNLAIKKTLVSQLQQNEIKGGPGRKTGNIIVGGIVLQKCKRV